MGESKQVVVDRNKRPTSLWTLRNWKPETEPVLPIVPIHHINAFLEDFGHDWNWHKLADGKCLLRYFSRVSDGNVWLLLEWERG